MSIEIFESFLTILAGSLFAAVLFRRAKLPTIVAYIVVGAVIGPSGFGLIDTPNQFQFIAELGVVFLLFSLGLEFSLPKLLADKSQVFGLGSFQVITCTLVFTLVVFLWGAGLGSAFIIAGALALSSTAIVTRELSQTGTTQSYHGRLAIGILLFQDLVAILFLILVPVLSGDGTSLMGELVNAILRGILLFSVLIAFGKWVLPLIYAEIGRTHSEEIFVLATLVLCLLSAWVTHAFHLSMALGGFVTGMMLGESPFKHQIESDIRPFKDILLGIFFVVIGMSIDLNMLAEYWLRIIVFTFALLVVKATTVSLAVWIRGHQWLESIKVGLILAQAGEFALALITLAVLNDVLPAEQASFILIIAMLSMLMSPLLIRKAPEIAYLIAKFFKVESAGAIKGMKTGETRETSTEKDLVGLVDHVIIGGYGRVGNTIGLLLAENQIPYVGIEHSIEKVNSLKQKGQPIVFGDCTQLKILDQVKLSKAQLVILTFKSLSVARATVQKIRNRYPDVLIFVRCYEQNHVKELIAMGVDKAIPEMLETSLMLAAEALTMLNIAPDKIRTQIDAERERVDLRKFR